MYMYNCTVIFYFQEIKRKVKLGTMQKRGILALKGKEDKLVLAKTMLVEHYKYKKTIQKRESLSMKQKQTLVQTSMSTKQHKERQRRLP